ncbi:YihY family inner membrane protein [Sulfurospirillum arcachonense]|uniref:YihY family inner membrane protein n=1 Tax=Sulfurospirillum arcachonense TaxID=57666 RepID=UPI000469BDD9|nr:YihY family inner membrane protein [Sulfurospirillum arcachonense]
MIKLREAIDFLKKVKDPSIVHYASSLSFHTILSLIPILLISFSIFTKLPSFKEYYAKIQHFIFNSLMPAQQDAITPYINKFLENTGSMGSTGLIFVLYVSIMFFLDYEKIISKIFKAQKRTLWESLSTYWTMLTMMPLGLALSFYLSSLVSGFLSSNEVTSSINFLPFLPYLIIWFLFFIMFTISANIALNRKVTILASFITSLIWYISKSLFVYYVAYNKTYLSIYGSFSILMFFFVWVYFSWLIYLYGAKLCQVLNEKQNQSQQGQENSNQPNPDSN